MAMLRDDLLTLNTRLTQEIIARLQDDEVLSVADARVYASVFAGVAHGLYGYIDYKGRQVFAHSADRENLIDHAWFWLRDGLKAALSAQRTVTFSGANGALIPAATVVRNELGVLYATQSSVQIVNGKVEVLARALVAGQSGNDELRKVSLLSPLQGVNADAVATAASGGSDEEDVEVLRARVLEKQGAWPLYGKPGDYAIWAKEVAGVTRAFERYSTADEKINLVRVYVLRDGDTSMVPDAAELALVQAHIDAVKPSRADVLVLAPKLKSVVYGVRVSPDTPEIRAAVKKKIEEVFIKNGALAGTIFISHVRAAVSAAEGEYDNAVQGSDVVCAADEVPVLGAINWL